jgi:hypothetical protein
MSSSRSVDETSPLAYPMAPRYSAASRDVPGPLLTRLLGPCDVVLRIDQGDMGEGLRKISQQPLGIGVILFRQQAEVVAQRKNSLEQFACVVTPADKNVGVSQPVTARQEGGAQRMRGRGRIERSRGGKLRGRIDQPRHDQGQCQLPKSLRALGKQLLKADPARSAEHRRDMPVRQGPDNLQAVRRHQVPAAQRRAQGGNPVRRPIR